MAAPPLGFDHAAVDRLVFDCLSFDQRAALRAGGDPLLALPTLGSLIILLALMVRQLAPCLQEIRMPVMI